MLRRPLAHHPHLIALLLLLVLSLLPAGAPAQAAGLPLEVAQQLLVWRPGAAQPVAQLLPGVRLVVRATFTNSGTAPLAVRADWDRMAYAAAGPPAGEALGRDHSELFRLAPGEARSFERPVPPPPVDEQYTATPVERVLVSVVTGCILSEPAQADSPCPTPADAPLRAVRDVLRAGLHSNDLGDAPDGSNHAGAAMLAYPGVPAAFPTVFDPAAGAPSGPLHRTPQPFHLGRRVSLEAEADGGPDQDPTTNLEPAANGSNRDRGDDGVWLDPTGLKHCQPASLQVSVFITPAFRAGALAAGVTQGRLNLWLDGSRDGDWADAVECPAGAPFAAEHILIDQPVDLAALSPGTNQITVTTSAVVWPDQLAARPAWLRASLSLAPAAKPLSVGDLRYGDGRGRLDEQGKPLPFMYGETEDYLINRGDAAQPDLQVHKDGRVIFDPETGQRVAVWTIAYRNAGDAPAQNVVLHDTLEGQNIIAILIGLLSVPELPYTPDGNALRFPIGTLAPGASGRIVIRTALPDGASGLTS